MDRPTQRRVTQRTIAEMAGVSQTTVSLVLNGKADAAHRIAPDTRDRVLAAIRDTTYVPNPVARSLVGATNDLIGVFTYEQTFPSAMSDFYADLLTGVEAAAERAGSDLLMFTSSPVVDGRRRLFHGSSRLRLADGCLLLGHEMDANDLERLVDSGYPFVAIGRREAAGGRVPYVGADYAAVTAELVGRAVALGHRRIALLHRSLAGESSRDRRGAVVAAGRDVELIEAEVPAGGVVAAWSGTAAHASTLAIVEDPLDALELYEHLTAAGVRVPEDRSVIALGDHGRLAAAGVDLTRLVAPRIALGEQAVLMLLQVMADRDAAHPPQALLPCALEPGATLAAPPTGKAA